MAAEGLTLEALLQEGEERLRTAGIEEYKSDAWYLFTAITGFDRMVWLLNKQMPVSEETAQCFEEAVEARLEGVPVQYLTGCAEFMGLTFYVDHRVLIPRFDTEVLVEQVLAVLKETDAVLDMCTGSGCIALSLAVLGHCQSMMGADISEDALEVAEKNRESLSQTYPELLCTELIQSNLFEHIDKTFDIIVSNPPYIKTAVVETLMPEVKAHEPRLALDGDCDGLYFYRAIIREAPDYLKPEGRLFFEIGYDQGEEVSELLKASGYTDIRVIKDLAGLDRVTSAVWPGQDVNRMEEVHV